MNRIQVVHELYFPWRDPSSLPSTCNVYILERPNFWFSWRVVSSPFPADEGAVFDLLPRCRPGVHLVEQPGYLSSFIVTKLP